MTQIGPYTVERLLSSSPTGAVHLCRTSVGSQVVVKTLAGHLSEDRRFLRLLRDDLLRLRDTPPEALARVVDVDVDGRAPLVVTEFLDAPTLGSAAGTGTGVPVPPDRGHRLAAALASALADLHEQDIVLGSLKPNRVVLTESGPRFLDFGVARALSRGGAGARRGQPPAFGVPAFLSPELALGEPLTPAADVFACAGLIVYALTGRPPFGAGPPRALIQRVVYAEPDLDGVPAPLAAVLAAAMRKDPTTRLSASQLRDQVLALPPADQQPTRVPGRRRPGHARIPALEAVTEPGAEPAPAAAALATAPPAPSALLELVAPDSAMAAPVTAEAPAMSDTDPVADAAPAAGTAPTDDAVPAASAPDAATSDAPTATAADPAAADLAEPAASDLAASDLAEPDAADAPGLPDPLTDAVLPAEKAPAGDPVVAVAGSPVRRGRWAWLTPPRVVGSVVMVAVVTLASVAVVGEIRSARDAADSRDLAAKASALLTTRPDLAGQLAVAAYRISPTPEAAQVLITAAVRETAQTGGAVHDVALSPDGATLLAASDTGVAAWDLRDPSRIRLTSTFLTDTGAVAALAPLPDPPDGADTRRLVATGGADGVARIWDVTDPARPAELAALRDSPAAITDIAVSADGALLATADAGGTVALWDIADRSQPRRLAAEELPGEARSVTFAPDGTALAIGGVGYLRVWDVRSPGSPRETAGYVTWRTVSQVRFSPDGQLLATASTPMPVNPKLGPVTRVEWDQSGGVELYLLAGGRRPRPIATFGARPAGVAGLEFSADGRTLVTGGGDGEIATWDLTFRARPVKGDTLRVDGTPRALALGGSGRGHVLAVVGDGSARVWQLDPAAAAEQVCARVGTRITRAEWLEVVPGRSFRAPCP
ncbi:MAG: hypothetical protein IRZ08_06550 [Frankia sp.]|nr:hypothetical protein [Frankia sp.]